MRKANFYAGVHLKESTFQNMFFLYRGTRSVDPHSDINYEEGVIRVLRHTELPAGDLIHKQGWVQDGTSTQRLRKRSLDLPL